MTTRENTNAFIVVDDSGRHRIVKEYRMLTPDDPVEYELAMHGVAITRLNDNEFRIPGSDVRLYMVT